MTPFAELRHFPWVLLMLMAYAADSIHASWSLYEHPDTFPRPYEWALELAPTEVWGVVWLVIAAMILAGILASRLWLIIGLACYSVACTIFGMSITALLWHGTPGAMIGAAKWFLVAAGAGHIMSHLPTARVAARVDAYI